VETISKFRQSCTHRVLLGGLPPSPAPHGRKVLGVRASLHLCAGGFQLLLLAAVAKKAKKVKVSRTGIAARFTQKGRWVEQGELRACCSLERRQR